MSPSIHPQAEHDLESALLFYRVTGSNRVALRFLSEFERVVDFITSNPEIGTPIREGRSRYRFQTFPYSIIFKKTPDGIRILVIRHDRRRPDFGMDRV